MGTLERLTLEDAAAPSLLALTHVHRYRLAAELCAGMRVLDLCCGSGYGTRILAGTAASVTGVDIHERSIEQAVAATAGVDAIFFEVADALEYLDRDLTQQFDALVLLEGLEHLRDPKTVVDRLRGHAAAGLSLIVSVPNEHSFPENNDFHVTEFGYDDVIALGESFDNAQVLGQTHAEGSLIGKLDAGEPGPSLETRLELSERADPRTFNHYLVVANLDATSSLAESSMQLSVAPNFHRYMLDLERENQSLRRTNLRLGRMRLGVADSAAAAALKRIDELGEPRAPATPTDADGSTLRAAARIVLNILPHGVTVRLMRHRNRIRAAADRKASLEQLGVGAEAEQR